MKIWKIVSASLLFLTMLNSSEYILVAQLSPKLQKYYFKWNNLLNPSKSKTIYKRDLKVSWNLQYLIWITWVSSYLTLTDKHKDLVKEIANIILTDKYAKNIEENKRNKTRNYDVVSSWEKDLKTSSLWLLLYRTITLLQDIEMVRKGSNNTYQLILKTLTKYEEKKWYKPDPKLYTILKQLEPEIQSVLKVHEFLDKQGLAKEMDYRKKEEAITKELARAKAELKEKNDVLAWKKWIIKEKNDILAWLDSDIKWLDKKIKELDEYIKTLQRFIKVNSKKQ
jgi:hypothetical protein